MSAPVESESVLDVSFESEAHALDGEAADDEPIAQPSGDHEDGPSDSEDDNDERSGASSEIRTHRDRQLDIEENQLRTGTKTMGAQKMSDQIRKQQQQQRQSAISELVFSSAQSAGHQFNHILSALKKSNLSMHNRLRSVQADAEFVQRVQRAYYYDPAAMSSSSSSSSPSSSHTPSLAANQPPPTTEAVPLPAPQSPRPRPLIANERCGSWYIPPSLKQGSAYFKSTDGHFGIWGFSTRRLNLQLLPLIGESDGCIIVDSTRRGKRMPDALSKTVPMWCCVLNRVLFPEGVEVVVRSGGRAGEQDGGGELQRHKLYTPPNAVSASEHAQMEARVSGHVEAFKKLGLDLEPYRKMLRKPLRPVWVTQESHLDEFEEGEEEEDGEEAEPSRRKGVTVFEDFHPVICCTSSRRVVGGEMSEGGYIQGAGDDTENWAFGLTPPVFWANADLLLSTPEAELPDLVRSLVEQADAAPTQATAIPSEPPVPSSQSPSKLDASTSWLSKHQQVAPGIYVARAADLDPSSASLVTSTGGGSVQSDANTPPPPQVCILTISQTTATDPKTWQTSPTQMAVGLGGKQSKIASRNLRAALPTITEFVGTYLRQQALGSGPSPSPRASLSLSSPPPSSSSSEHANGPKILIVCPSGKDLSVGVALALVCQHCTTTSSGSGGQLIFSPRSDTDGVNKTLIKSRLGHIMTLFPDANPSRATLQSVNSYLMG